MINIEATEKPKYYQLRWKISNLFMRLARRVYPESPEVKAFYLQMLHDYMIAGKFVTRVDWKDTIIEKEKK